MPGPGAKFTTVARTMYLLQYLHDFFAVGPLLGYWQAVGHRLAPDTVFTLDAMRAALPAIFPALLALEFLFLLYVNRAQPRRQYQDYKIPVLSNIANLWLGKLVALDLGMLAWQALARHAPLQVGVSWGGFLYGLLVWELGNYIFHYSCHKVRLLWCLHAPHHAPARMNLSVIWTGFFLHGAYASLVRFAVAALCGLSFELLMLTIVTIGVWGAFIHVSEEILPSRRRDGWLSLVFIGPSDHRVHHASNAVYIDKNYCNLFTLWDRLFGSYQTLLEGQRPVYGLMREVDQASFVDMYCGEWLLMWRDMRRAGNLGELWMTVFGPPGWRPAVAA